MGIGNMLLEDKGQEVLKSTICQKNCLEKENLNHSKSAVIQYFKYKPTSKTWKLCYISPGIQPSYLPKVKAFPTPPHRIFVPALHQSITPHEAIKESLPALNTTVLNGRATGSQNPVVQRSSPPTKNLNLEIQRMGKIQITKPEDH